MKYKCPSGIFKAARAQKKFSDVGSEPLKKGSDAITRLSTAVTAVSEGKHWMLTCLRITTVFSCLTPPPPLSSRAVHVHPSSPLNRPALWSASVLTRVRQLAGFLRVTQRDVISNRCRAFICSVGAWRGRGLWADPCGLWSMEPQKEARRQGSWEKRPRFVNGCSPRCCSYMKYNKMAVQEAVVCIFETLECGKKHSRVPASTGVTLGLCVIKLDICEFLDSCRTKQAAHGKMFQYSHQ